MDNHATSGMPTGSESGIGEKYERGWLGLTKDIGAPSQLDILHRGPDPDSTEVGRAGHGTVDVSRTEDLIRQLLAALGENPDREGLRGTPRRVAAWWSEFLDHEAGRTDTTFGHSNSGDGYVLMRDIITWSLCEHHLLPFRLRIAIAYIPSGRVLGLSKLVRLVSAQTHRLQIQERITNDVAQAVSKVSGTEDVAVYADGEHLCMSMRGVQAEAARTSTVCLLGRFRTDPALTNRIAGTVYRNAVGD